MYLKKDFSSLGFLSSLFLYVLLWVCGLGVGWECGWECGSVGCGSVGVWECGSVGVWAGWECGSVGVWAGWECWKCWECWECLLFIRPSFRPFSLRPPLGLSSLSRSSLY
ncbi:hypothetical protein RhiirA4_483446 [Rhizophagus irregularis]|uniref:Uncharacterized protein n=1 Tax=Rhizophagus irregularis TaxID=588596 RepID=A0A2I1HMM4_9GLOM|nr:hypothetical protein RhiirA4_483446 [Rhizophagus irregularis]